MWYPLGLVCAVIFELLKSYATTRNKEEFELATLIKIKYILLYGTTTTKRTRYLNFSFTHLMRVRGLSSIGLYTVSEV